MALSTVELGRLADAVAALLADPQLDLNQRERFRWEGALTALEVSLGRQASLIQPDIAEQIRRLL